MEAEEVDAITHRETKDSFLGIVILSSEQATLGRVTVSACKDIGYTNQSATVCYMVNIQET